MPIQNSQPPSFPRGPFPHPFCLEVPFSLFPFPFFSSVFPSFWRTASAKISHTLSDGSPGIRSMPLTSALILSVTSLNLSKPFSLSPTTSPQPPRSMPHAATIPPCSHWLSPVTWGRHCDMICYRRLIAAPPSGSGCWHL